MKLLILSCHTGQGHDSASAAIREVWEERGHCCETADALAFVSPWVSRQVARWHVRIYRYLPGLFRWGYAFAEKHPSAFGEKKMCTVRSGPGGGTAGGVHTRGRL